VERQVIRPKVNNNQMLPGLLPDVT